MDIKKIIKKTGYTSILTSIILAIIGLIMFMYSETTLKIIAYAIGIFLIITGIVKIITYGIQKGGQDLFNYEIVYGIISVVFGIVIMINTQTFQGLLGIIIGIWIIYSSLMRFALALKLKNFEIKSWFATLVIAVLMMLCGIYILFVPDIIVATLGAILFIYAIMDIIEGIVFITKANKIEN